MRDRLDALRKPLLAVLITHGHPDHYNGVGELIRGLDDVPIIATQGVDEAMRRTDDAKAVKWQPVFGDDWPARRTFPNRLVHDGDVLHFDGVSFEVREFGGRIELGSRLDRGTPPACRLYRRHGFQRRPFLHERRPHGGLVAQPRRARTAFRRHRTVLHGARAGGQAARNDYRAACLYWVLSRGGGPARQRQSQLDDAGKAELEAIMKRFLPTSDLDVFIKAGADAVAAELALQVSDGPFPPASRLTSKRDEATMTDDADYFA